MVEFQITITVRVAWLVRLVLCKVFLLLSQPPESRVEEVKSGSMQSRGFCETDRDEKRKTMYKYKAIGSDLISGLMPSVDLSFPFFFAFFSIFHRLFLFLPSLVLPFLFFDL